MEVYCQPTASDATVMAVNTVLAGWRFDRVPVGDSAWAVVTARALLPVAVTPNRFLIIGGQAEDNVPVQASQANGSETRLTLSQRSGDNVEVTFTYQWGEPLRADDTPAHSHFWHYDARPSGDVVLVGEGGDSLPAPTQSTS